MKPLTTVRKMQKLKQKITFMKPVLLQSCSDLFQSLGRNYPGSSTHIKMVK